MFSAIASRTKTKRIQPFILASLVLLGACEKTPPQAKTPDETPPSSTPSSSTPDESTPPNGAATAAAIALSPLTVSDALPPQARSVAWKPPVSEIEPALRAALEARGESSGVLLEASAGSATHPATFHYAALELPAAPNSTPNHMLSASFDLQGRPTNWSSSRTERIQIVEELPPDDDARKALLMRLIDASTSALLLRQKIAATPDAQLLDAVEELAQPKQETADALPLEVAIDTTQRLRQMRKAAPKSVDAARATTLLRAFATRDEPTLVPVVFTALHEYDALDGLGPLMVEAATRASQNNQLPVYLSLLSQMTRVSDPATRAYLESVASGHPEETIRQIAKESLEKQQPPQPRK